MKKSILLILSCVSIFLFLAPSSSLEARHHHRQARVQVGVRNNYMPAQQTIVRRYVAPVAVPVYPASPYYAPGYIAPEYMYMQPTYPGYVEEVYTVQQRPVSFSGLSFSLNFFR